MSPPSQSSGQQDSCDTLSGHASFERFREDKTKPPHSLREVLYTSRRGQYCKHFARHWAEIDQQGTACRCSCGLSKTYPEGTLYKT